MTLLTERVDEVAAPTPPTPLAAQTVRHRPSWSSLAVWGVLSLLIIAPVGCFLSLGVSPRLLGQGSQWFTLTYVRQALSGYTGRGIVDSLWVASLVAVVTVTLATVAAWLVQRTDLPGRRLWTGLMWALFIMPSWTMTLGWSDLLQPYGTAHALGVNTGWLYGEFLGPLGIVVVLTTVALPFAYFVVAAGLEGLGPDVEDAARIHGAGRWRTVATVVPLIAPALFSAVAIAFAETVSDFGVAFTLGYHAHFPLATYTLFNAISTFPANFPVAAVIAAVLIGLTVIPIAAQSRVTRRRSYAVTSGRTRALRRRELSRRGRIWAVTGLSLGFAVALGVPLLGALVGSFVRDLGIYSTGGVRLTTAYYHQVFASSIAGKSLGAPLWLSNKMGLVVATATVALAVVLARRLAATRGGWSQRITDVFLLGAVAVPGVVLGIGYIFFYDLPFVTRHVVDIYKTLPLLMLALVASSVPGQTRFLAGPVGQIQPSMAEAARVHGAGRWLAWRTSSLPLMSRILLWGWLLTFTKAISELAIAQILYPPSQEPASVTIESYLANYAAGIGTAMTVVTLVEVLAVIGVATIVYRYLAPRGWRRIGATGSGA
jgi:iron(III) transport system permease protein